MNHKKMPSRYKYHKQIRKKKRPKLRFRKWVIVVFLIFFLSLFLVSINQVYNWFKDNKEIDKLSNQTIENTSIKEKKDNKNTEKVNPPEDKAND